ncbi:nucleotidyl transferase AbiEii/AbiGii toxin family protein [Streptomyces sp. NPDC048436]|uniref:nucleotidyl transferase AbiEii/AbiGii toxin family protein n=1 Tax=Streptomyces sp. NPDC048436 TaxID=3365550 RepID=UPI003713B8EC
MLDRSDLARVGAEYGAAEGQVRRDHLISHVLWALASLDLPVVFFGGTALSRTYLTTAQSGGRLSEDIDLFTENRPAVAEAIGSSIPRLLRREFPRSRWEPALSDVRGVDPAQLVTGDGLRLRVQLLATNSGHSVWKRWPIERHSVELRYRDIPGPAVLRVPTLAAFVAMKVSAYCDRHAPRDLFDLAALAQSGAISADAAELVRIATGTAPAPHMFSSSSLPQVEWETQLAHQTGFLPSAEECLDTVRAAFADTLDWPPPYDPFA